jgi:hypothetical protein
MFSHRENRSQSMPDGPVKSDDARDQLARLYREIGISAVAAALHIGAKDDPRGESTPRPVPIQRTDRAA